MVIDLLERFGFGSGRVALVMAACPVSWLVGALVIPSLTRRTAAASSSPVPSWARRPDGASGLFHGVPRAARPKGKCSARSSPRPERRRRPFQAHSSLYSSTFQARRRPRSPVHPTQAPPSSR